jgi:hypothetical protein
MNTLENLLTKSPERLAIMNAIKTMYDNPFKFNLILDNYSTTAKYVILGVFEDIFERIIRELYLLKPFVFVFQKEHKYFSKPITPDYFEHTLEILKNDDIWYDSGKLDPTNEDCDDNGIVWTRECTLNSIGIRLLTGRQKPQPKPPKRIHDYLYYED